MPLTLLGALCHTVLAFHHAHWCTDTITDYCIHGVSGDSLPRMVFVLLCRCRNDESCGFYRLNSVLYFLLRTCVCSRMDPLPFSHKMKFTASDLPSPSNNNNSHQQTKTISLLRFSSSLFPLSGYRRRRRNCDSQCKGIFNEAIYV